MSRISNAVPFRGAAFFLVGMRRKIIGGVGLIGFVCFLCFLLSGCVSTARYRIQKSIPKNAPPQFTREIREEVSEDDKVVDPNTVLPAISS